MTYKNAIEIPTYLSLRYALKCSKINNLVEMYYKSTTYNRFPLELSKNRGVNRV